MKKIEDYLIEIEKTESDLYNIGIHAGKKNTNACIPN